MLPGVRMGWHALLLELPAPGERSGGKRTEDQTRLVRSFAVAGSVLPGEWLQKEVELDATLGWTEHVCVSVQRFFQRSRSSRT